MKKRWWISVMALLPVLPVLPAAAQSVKPRVLAATGAWSLSSSLQEERNNAGFMTNACLTGESRKDTGFFTPGLHFTLKPARLLPVAVPQFSASAPAPAPVYRIAPDAYYQQHFGFFCKQEWSWQKQTGVPVKLRLGNYSYAQQQEGKH